MVAVPFQRTIFLEPRLRLWSASTVEITGTPLGYFGATRVPRLTSLCENYGADRSPEERAKFRRALQEWAKQAFSHTL